MDKIIVVGMKAKLNSLWKLIVAVELRATLTIFTVVIAYSDVSYEDAKGDYQNRSLWL
jgi:hypothetical protein